MIKSLKGNFAAAEAVKLCRPKVLSYYPITPQTTIIEKLSEYVDKGELDAIHILAESEHSAMSMIIAAEATGVRTFTATSSQGLAYMHEMLYTPPGMRLPIYMINVNRMVGSPGGIWCEYNDSMAERDLGWIQFYAANNQEIFDYSVMAYKIAENEKVLLPFMMCYDGLILSHTTEPVVVRTQEEVDEFLPSYNPHCKLDPNNPMSLNSFSPPMYSTEWKLQIVDALSKSSAVIKEVIKEFNDKSHSDYSESLIDVYNVNEYTKSVLITIGSMHETAIHFINNISKRDLGLIRIKFYRPFPVEDIVDVIKEYSNIESIGVIDRCIGDPLYTDVRSALYGVTNIPIKSFMLGLGGRDITTNDIKNCFKKISC